MEDSVPMQLTSSRIMLPVPCPKVALPTALVAVIEIRKLETSYQNSISIGLTLQLLLIITLQYFR